jgi:hypothetical protein
MRAISVIVLLACVITSTVLSQAPHTKSILATELDQIDVIGELDVPLGTVVDIEATIVSGKSLRLKAFDGQYLLNVTKVDGKTLKKPRVCEFVAAPGNAANLATDSFQLHQLKKGERAGRLTETLIEELEKDYVGQPLKLSVYELGSFKGLPRTVPEGIGFRKWQDSGFTFTTYLRVLSRRE